MRSATLWFLWLVVCGSGCRSGKPSPDAGHGAPGGPIDGGWTEVRLTGSDWVDLRPATTPAELSHLSIDQLPNLTTTRGLEVQRVWAQTDVWNNPNLRDLSGLSGAALSGRVGVIRNAVLPTLGRLTLVPDARFGLHLEVRGNPALESLGSLGASLAFRGVVLEDNPRLTDLGGLEAMTSCEILKLHGLGVASLSALHNLSGDRPLSLTVSGNPHLASLEGLGGVRRLIVLVIEDNAALQNLEALGKLEELRVARLVIRNNPKLESLAPLLQARVVEGLEGLELDVSGNPLVPPGEVEALRRKLTGR